MFVPAYTEQEARDAVAASLCYSQALRLLGLRPVGGNHRVFRRYVDEVWQIPTEHFDSRRAQLTGLARRSPTPLGDVLVAGSQYDRGKLKRRLYAEGLKQRRCELCGQGEDWRGRSMALILDHVNGVPTDNRIENLRIVCPNCAATLDTHCGRKNKRDVIPRVCACCGLEFAPKYASHRYCSQHCGRRSKGSRAPLPEKRKVERPSYEQLMADVRTMSFLAVGRKYGVSDNAVRKWIRWYENEAERGRSVETEEPREGRAA
jgi:hypothetical protein